MREFNWIEHYFLPLTNGQSSALNLKDDAALLRIENGYELVITTDTLNEQIHFLTDTPAHLIAQKALAVNLSDIAAMGAKPLAYSLALSLPQHTNDAWLKDFCDGLQIIQSAHDCYLLGGDTTRTNGPLSLSITAYATVRQGAALTRNSAIAGDTLYVTGTIGDAYLGLHALQHGHDAPELIARYHTPTPRLDAAEQLAGKASACMDVSDGLVQDCGHLARCSGVAAKIDATAIPLSDAARRYIEKHNIEIRELITGGDDYELLFSSNIEINTNLATAIGQLSSGSGVVVKDENAKPMTFAQTGYQHF